MNAQSKLDYEALDDVNLGPAHCRARRRSRSPRHQTQQSANVPNRLEHIETPGGGRGCGAKRLSLRLRRDRKF